MTTCCATSLGSSVILTIKESSSTTNQSQQLSFDSDYFTNIVVKIKPSNARTHGHTALPVQSYPLNSRGLLRKFNRSNSVYTVFICLFILPCPFQADCEENARNIQSFNGLWYA